MKATRSDAAAVLAKLVALGGAGSEIVEFGRSQATAESGPGRVRIGVHRHGALPRGPLDEFDILLSANADAPCPWVGTDRLDDALAGLIVAIERQPVAATVAAQVLRMSLVLPFGQALLMESLAYSMLLASGGFRAWRAAKPARVCKDGNAPRIISEHDGDTLRIRLNRPEVRNAFDTAMRDELVAALEYAITAASSGRVELSGIGLAFSAGGDLDEFGRADDVGLAHLIRTLQSATRLVDELNQRLFVRLHGACIGSGIEIAAAAAHVAAETGAFFRLPEVGMGLIPGAGGTASIPRRIGRQRACYMVVSGADLDCNTALAWGLVDEVER